MVPKLTQKQDLLTTKGRMSPDRGETRNWMSGKEDLSKHSFDLEIQPIKAKLLAQEDTDKDGKITINDTGPKIFSLKDNKDSQEVQITGTYHVANLLQELALAEGAGQTTTNLQGSKIAENPVDRISRRIKDEMWKALFRRIDGPTIVEVAKDPKDRAERAVPRIYVPETATGQYEYYQQVAKEYPESNLEVCILPKGFYQKPWDLRAENGILALEMQSDANGLHPVPYVVPGHRFNEFYGWDSYFSALGLLEIGNVDAARDIARHYMFEIEHYGSVLNANRSYYLGRSHPPFLTDLVLRVYERMEDRDKAREFRQQGIAAAIREYHNVWVSQPRLDPTTGLSRYRANQVGVPPEVEEGHYNWFLQPFADKEGISIDELVDRYNNGVIQDAELDNFFLHDRSIRESGHDNSYRVEGQCADLATTDLNSLLYKYEMDIARTIEDGFDHHTQLPSDIDGELKLGSSSIWFDRAARRKRAFNQYLWDSESGMFHDYNTASGKQTHYKSITTFWALWCGVATAEQAKTMVSRMLPYFEQVGGATSTVEQPYEESGPAIRQRQWDYPFGWAPHQMTLWDALRRYGYDKDAQRLAYKWLYLITRIAVDYNGTITEKYDVTKQRIDPTVDAEYGNQGLDFQGVPMQGFGWTNASYSYGLTVIGEQLLEKLRAGYQWDEIQDWKGKF